MKKSKKTQIVKVSATNVTKERKKLADKLDKIDEFVRADIFNGFCASRLRIELSMWRKGKAIAAYFTLLKYAVSYRKLSRDLGRSDVSLRKWHKLYEKYPDRKEYQQIAERKAEEWTAKVFVKMYGLTEPEEQGKLVGDESAEPKDKVKKKQVVMDSIDEVCRKLNHRLSKFGELNTLGKPKMFTQKKDDYTGLLMLVDSQELKQLRATLNKIFRLEKDRPVI